LPGRAPEGWLAAASIDEGPVFRRIWPPPVGTADGEPPLPRISRLALTAQSVGPVVNARAVAARFGRHELDCHGLKRGALTTGTDRGLQPAKLKRLGRQNSFDVLGEYLEFGDLFDGYPLTGVL
jgi:hypothetical protein